MRPTSDTAEARKQVHLNLRKAFSLINKSLKDEVFIAAYVTAFSIIEDRIFSMYVVAKRVETKEDVIQRNPRTPLINYINYLVSKKAITRDVAKKIEAETIRRNQLLHGAMWRLDEFTEEETKKVVTLAKEMNTLRTAQRKVYGVGYKVD